MCFLNLLEIGYKMEIETLVETYATLKQYIPSKDCQEAADNLVSLLVDHLSDHDLKEFCSADSYLRQSYKDYTNDFEDDEPDDY